MIVKLRVIFGNLSFKLPVGTGAAQPAVTIFHAPHSHHNGEQRHTQLLAGGVRGIRLEYNREGTMINLYLLLFGIIHII